MLISACMIVKNEEKMLAKTLPNLVGLVDEVVLVDTGSTDKTVEIAEKFKVKVFYFTWINDFSAARNEALKHAKGDWILSVDADEFIKKEDIAKIKNEIKETKNIGLMVKVCECYEGNFNTVSFNLRPKVFKNKMGIYFRRPINEEPHTRDGKPVVLNSGISSASIYHWGGLLSSDILINKKKRNIALLKKIIEQGQGDQNYHFILARNYSDLEFYDEALLEFEMAEKLSDSLKFKVEVKIEKAWLFYGRKQIKQAYAEAVAALKLDTGNIAGWNILATILIALGDNKKAVGIVKEAISMPLKEDDIIVNLRQRDYVANLILNRAYLNLGMFDEAHKTAKLAYEFDSTDEARNAMEKSLCR